MAVDSAAFAVVALLLAVRHFVVSGWPLDGGHPLVVAAVGALFVLAYGLKAPGWGRLFLRESGLTRSRLRPRTAGPQALVVLAGAAIFLFALAWQSVLRLRVGRDVEAGAVS